MTDLFDSENRELDHRRLLGILDALDREIPENPQPLSAVAPKAIQKLRDRVSTTINRLSLLNRAIDPVQHHDVYDPSHPLAAADLIAERLVRQARVALGGLQRFYGAGV